MNINFSYKADPIPTGIVRVIAYKASDPNTEVTRQDYFPPHINPRDVSLFVPSPVVHIVRIYETPDVGSVGLLKAEYVATPSFDGPIVIPPLMIKVGRGIANRDPTDNSTEVAIPSISSYTISWIEQRGAGPLRGGNDTNDPTQVEWLPRPGGGVELQNGKTFYQDEEYWLYFEPTLDGNVSAAVQDLTDLLEAHINDHTNPHQVTKNQVGLGNLPNATTNSYQEDDPNKLATAKAVHDLWASLTGVILARGFYNIGSIPAQSDQLYTVTHGLNLPFNSYMVIGNLQMYGGDWNNDNDILFTTRDMNTTAFQLTVRNIGGASASGGFNYIIVKRV